MRNFLSYSVIIFILYFSSFESRAQFLQNHSWGVKVGLVANFGSHINQIGLRLNGYGNLAFAQLNIENTSTFSFQNLAERNKMWENRFALGGVILGGTRNRNLDFVWGGLNHQTAYKNAIGYNFLWYRDNRKSSQNSGGWTIQSNKFQLFFENDIFAGTGKDKFRTGHLQIRYQEEYYNINIGIALWTGETKGSHWEKIPMAECPNGFRILENLPFGMTSHGILYTGVDYLLQYGNIMRAQLGFDSEQVRHVFQNRISHDMILFPKQLERKTPHYPRLDSNGCPVFTKEDMRKTRFYGQLGLNNTWSY